MFYTVYARSLSASLQIPREPQLLPVNDIAVGTGKKHVRRFNISSGPAGVQRTKLMWRHERLPCVDFKVFVSDDEKVSRNHYHYQHGKVREKGAEAFLLP
eukprot:Blabericola_migrator_1__2698@NODE_1767_length_3824_cov_33_091030_g1140_i0_p4_GENE_NODE_1767_length_3824_cov_33_091030_g1140_i0NODE_1767_length_3824_cov_33_091030_g1140_i0_p4_ORF_typecomplete_len100_score6_82COLFI/PF01410_18/3COLFI/PF01410_18/19_NODE_1767_length_3824_cov_33_091030_g1140_i016471946